MIRLLFVVFVCLGGFAALALWSARDGGGTAAVGELLPEEIAAAVKAEVERFDASLAALLPGIPRVGEETTRRGETANDMGTASDPEDTGSGGNAAAAIAAAAVTPAPRRAESLREKPRDRAASIEVHDVAPLRDFALDLGNPDNLTTADDPADDDAPQPVEPRITAGSLDDAERAADAADSADLIRRMLAVYARTHERR
jgi:hypothetical protein